MTIKNTTTIDSEFDCVELVEGNSIIVDKTNLKFAIALTKHKHHDVMILVLKSFRNNNQGMSLYQLPKPSPIAELNCAEDLKTLQKTYGVS